MKLTKRLEAEILKAYNEYWDAYLKGDMQIMSYWMHDNIRMIGSGRGEFFDNKKKTIKYYKSTADQVAGKADMRKRKISVLPVGDQILVNEECDFYVLIDSVWTFYEEGRISTLFTKTNKGWKIIQEHGSMPDARTAGGEQVNTDKIKAENVRLKDAVKRRTIELEEKNHELEIETALEKVRAVAMGMHKPNDLLNVCEVMYKEFLSLGFSEIRNAIININNDTDGSFINYDYAEAAGKNFGHFKNNVLPFVDKIIKIGKSKEDAFSETYISGKALAEFKRLRKKTGQKNDPKLNKAKSLYFYFYSIGIGTIGISTFGAISKAKKALLKRFRNVFALAYQRFMDIEKAEAQAKEARIEMALERVRARTMAMQRSDELPETTYLLFQQLKELGQTAAQISIGIVKGKFVELSATVHGNPMLQTYHIPADEPFMMKKAVKVWKEKKGSLTIKIEGKRLKEYNGWRNSVLKKKISFPEKRWIVNLAFFSKGMLSFSSDKEVSKETSQLLERFASVFDQTYTRFLDLQKAEAQAKEAEIELALERVRARTMAMQKSDELKETTLVLFQQFKALGATTAQVSICIFDEGTTKGEMFVTLKGEKIDRSFPMDLDAESFVMKRAKKAFLKNQKTFSITITGKELQNYNQWRNLLIGKKGWNESVAVRKQSWYVNAVFFSRGMMGISSDSPPSDEALKLLERFGNVFDLTFTRFLDLQKAEAQAKEAQIEAALEKVRSCSLAVNNVNEFNEVVKVVFEKLSEFQIPVSSVTIATNTEESKDFVVFGCGEGQAGLTTLKFNLPYFSNVFIDDLVQERSKSTVGYFSKVYSEKEKNSYYEYVFRYTELKNLPEDLKQQIRNSKSYGLSVAFAKNSVFMVNDFDGNTLDDNQSEILKRFSTVFEQAYIRFLDLQKAEAQAREAQIEIGLERVRSRAMAMQSSEELNALIGTVFTELTKLDLVLTRCIIWVFEPATNAARWWMANIEEPSNPISFFIKYHEHPAYLTFVKEWENQNVKFVYDLKGKDKIKWDEILFNETELKNLPDVVKNGMRAPERVLLSASFNNFGGINVASLEPLSDEHFDILLRFAKVFDLTYTRFNDLKQAEAQAREAQIEAALERVRSRTMAMHKTSELQEVIHTVHHELLNLNLSIDGGSFVVINEDIVPELRCWGSGGTANTSEEVLVPHFNMPFCTNLMTGIKKGPGFFTEEFSQREKKEYFTKLFKHKPWSDLSSEQKKITLSSLGGYARSVAVSKHTSIFIINHQGRKFTESEDGILKRFAKVFEQTYTRFLDLKNAEAQAREAQIELALERVRAKTMAMHKSDELKEAGEMLWNELGKLGIESLSSGYVLMDKEEKIGWIYAPNPATGKIAEPLGVLYNETKEMRKVLSYWKKQEPLSIIEMNEQETIAHQTFIAEKSLQPDGTISQWITAEQLIALSPKKLFLYNFNFKQGSLMIVGGNRLTDQQVELMLRFTKVFQQTYTRFLDLQKAEAQAREAQIEAGLERVRSRAMAMHSSEDVTSATVIMFTELEKLGIENFRCGINYIKTDRTQEVWSVTNSAEEKTIIAAGSFTIDAHPFWKFMYEAWTDKKEFLFYYLTGKEKEDYVEILNATPNYLSQPIRDFPDIYFQIYFFGEGAVWAMSLQPHSEEDKRVMKRFAAVFSLTFRRYKDLQKAEAQAREAQIEAALERVRSKTMAMHNSQDIAETVDILFHELIKLHVETLRCGISIIHDTGEMEVWTANPDADGKASLTIGKLSMSIYPSLENLFEAWKNKESHFVYDLSGQDLVDYFTAINNAPDYPIRYDLSKLPPRQVINCFLFAEGALFAFTTELLTSEAIAIFKRFATLFGQTYRRYLDLQKAEALAREATIEAALEKVRGKAMAMYSSDDLAATASMVFTELRKLGINPIRCGVGLLNKESRKAQLYSATSSANEDGLSLVGWVQLEKHPVLEKIYDTWLQQKDYYPQLQGEQLRSYYKLLLAGLSVHVPDFSNEQKQFGHFIPFSIGCLYAWSDVSYNEDQIKILKRFAGIIDLTFRRYLELQQSEANAKEAVKQAALDRIRADIASMRTLGDLNRIIPLIWNELTILGLPFIRCGVFIMDNEHQLIHTFLSTPEGKAIAAFHIPYETPGKIKLIPENWKKKTAYIDHWNDSDFIDFANTLVQQHVIDSSEQYLAGIPHGGFFLHFIPFLQGMLYVGNTIRLGKDEIGLIESVADAFSTAYARYEDFNKLEAAKKQVDKTLTDLRQTQQQLVQSEKMASLGEMTAGIAHEIQNPLNFVNNFSDVSTELLEEMKQELATGNLQQATEIADDVIQNLEKILLHGKRADGIVKSMLQHSRASSGKKEPTDINALCDEYLRLSFHGLRAKDKTFNAKFETELDPTIGKINIVGQDIGRVILNLINNAFYAVSEKKKQADAGYEPTVTVTTKNLVDKVEVRVKDNGAGMSQKVLDKIFQPFFTTKPTGQGTGLGLSLSYDIITKGHGGELKVETKEGEGSVFIISLPV